MRLQHKVAVITGGASGMGRATVHRFLHEGARVVIADYNAEAGAALLNELEAEGFEESVSFLRTDVAVEADVEAALNHAVTCVGALDVVFNNAGVGGAVGPLTETTGEDWDYTFDVLAKGVFFGIKHAARIMRGSGHGGAIINTASIAGLSGDGGPLVYSAAKAAVINMTMSAAVELLASDDAAFVTGESLLVDGGLTAAGPELSKTFPYASARNAKVAGITRGSTGETPILRKL
ncbi:MAG: SDR family NAD(P)-dependent oxidoreductase [Gammaproteobacteria bacterium]